VIISGVIKKLERLEFGPVSDARLILVALELFYYAKYKMQPETRALFRWTLERMRVTTYVVATISSILTSRNACVIVTLIDRKHSLYTVRAQFIYLFNHLAYRRRA